MSEGPTEKQTSDYAASFRELRVYQTALALSLRVFEISRLFPGEEKYSLTDQIRRASRAIAANLAEAWAKRRYPAAFVAKLSDCLGEVFETQAWLDQSKQCGYITPETHHELDSICLHLGAMLRSMEIKADTFCGPRK